MQFNKLLFISVFMSFVITPMPLLAASKSDLRIEEIKRGVPISRIKPKYPTNAAIRGQEGWVVLSFVVDKYGKVNSTIIEDTSNGKVFNKAAEKAIKQWVYEPTTINGQAVEQCKNTVRFDFKLQNKKQGVRKKFIRSYDQIVKLIEAQKFDDATLSIEKLQNKDSWNLYENAWIISLKAQLYNGLGDENKELAMLRALNYGNKSYFDDETTLDHLVRLFNLNVDHKLYSEALNVAKQVKDNDKKKQVYFKLEKVVFQIKKFLNSDGEYIVKGKLSDEGVWGYGLARRTFGLTGDLSKLSKVDVRCDNKHSVYPITQDSVWTTQDSWGQCRVIVYGDKNSSVNLVEIKNKI